MEFDWANILEGEAQMLTSRDWWPMNQTGLTGELLGVCREQGVGAAPSDRGGISGRWLHGWSVVVTAVDRWHSFSKYVLSSLGEIKHTLVLYSCRFWALRIIRSKSKQQNIGKQNQWDFKLKGTQTSEHPKESLEILSRVFIRSHSPSKGNVT